MATWGLHMRIAENLLQLMPDLDEVSFLVGNIGPDCGVPNEDWSQFDPPTEISHWTKKGKSNIQAEAFYNTYLSHETDDLPAHSLYTGYYVHLLTDIAFHQLFMYKLKNDPIYKPYETDKKFIWTIKKDWYDLDHLYFRDHPNSIFHRVFKHIDDFPNYLDYYPNGAIIRQVKYITQCYNNPSENLDRDYIYLSKEEMSTFLQETTQSIHKKILEKKAS